MYFYHGNRHYYMTRIFLNDKELQEVVYAYGLIGDYERFSYALADEIYTYMDTFLKDNSLSAQQYYDKEYAECIANPGYTSKMLTRIQTAIYNAYNKAYVWNQKRNQGLYVAILKSLLYGSIKHFFFENRNKYLPQYDWYLINNNPKRKDIMNMLFREFDKLTNATDALRYYQDPDDIPLEFLIYLQEITGLSMNDYSGVFTEKQLRSLTKHLVEVWREKGSLFSIELFFACMGIQCDTAELWFDRRLFDNPSNFNEYTKVQNPRRFGYYLTPNKPHTVSYEFSPETVNYSMYTDPRSSRIWEHVVGDSEGLDEVKNLLGISDTPEKITYTFFKSNYILINFFYVGENRSITKAELDIYKELVNYMLPVFIRVYYGNEYESAYGNDDWDILNGRNNDTKVDDIKNGKTRDATPLGLLDTKTVNHGTDPNPEFTYDSYPADVVGSNFVSGSYILVYDIRLSQYMSNNHIEEGQLDGNELVSSPKYDFIGGGIFISDTYPAFYGSGYDYLNLGNNVLIRLDSETGTEGELVIETSDDASDAINQSTLTRYYFEVNGSDRQQIYPYLFAEDNNGQLVSSSEGCYDAEGIYNETFSSDLEYQLDWTYDIPETEELVEHIPLETFDPPYINGQFYNLFEISKYNNEVSAVNDLYNDDGTWNTDGSVQYEYYEYTNPLECIESKLNNTLQIMLI